MLIKIADEIYVDPDKVQSVHCSDDGRIFVQLENGNVIKGLCVEHTDVETAKLFSETINRSLMGNPK